MQTVKRADWTPPTRRRVRALRDRLRLVYGRPSAPPHRQPLDELILTVLSQSTNDRNRDVAFLRLRARFGSWAEVRDAPNADVEAAIRPGGISKVKSARIQAILRELDDPPSLDHLADLDVAEARAELVALPGVGRKTAACVLLFAYGMADVPVDTHVSRVGTRLALFRPGAPVRGAPRRHARDHPARAGARVPRQPAPPRAPHLPRAAARVPELRPAPDVPVADVVTTYLELTDPAAIRPARGSAEVVRVDPPDGAVNRRFYEEVGARLPVDRAPRARRRLVAGARGARRDVGDPRRGLLRAGRGRRRRRDRVLRPAARVPRPRLGRRAARARAPARLRAGLRACGSTRARSTARTRWPTTRPAASSPIA